MTALLAKISTLPLIYKLLAFAGLAIATHMLVILVRYIVNNYLRSQPAQRYQKTRSVATLVSSGVIFMLYFLAIGLILQEFGVSLLAYLASASVLGLAIGFGSQGIVQDVVTGLTFIFSDLVDVGDVVEISAQTGIVKGITMRFVELENALGAKVFIPNRTINNVINYPRGYVRCLVDITLTGDAATRDRIERCAHQQMYSVHEQFPGISIVQPTVEGRQKLPSGKEFVRIKFRIWPNRGQPIETVFTPELVAEVKQFEVNYAPWMIAISYEAEEKDIDSGHALRWAKSNQSKTRKP